MESSLYIWAAQSLGSAATATLNDFASPIVYLVVAAVAAIKSNYPYTPSQGLPFFLGGSVSNSSKVLWGNSSSSIPPWGNRTVTGTNPADVPNTGEELACSHTQRCRH